jgi:hypothetical protein
VGVGIGDGDAWLVSGASVAAALWFCEVADSRSPLVLRGRLKAPAAKRRTDAPTTTAPVLRLPRREVFLMIRPVADDSGGKSQDGCQGTEDDG